MTIFLPLIANYTVYLSLDERIKDGLHVYLARSLVVSICSPLHSPFVSHPLVIFLFSDFVFVFHLYSHFSALIYFLVYVSHLFFVLVTHINF